MISNFKKIKDSKKVSFRQISLSTGIRYETLKKLYDNKIERIDINILLDLADFLEIHYKDLLLDKFYRKGQVKRLKDE